MTKILGTSIIGDRRSGQNPNSFAGINPATGDSLDPQFISAKPEDVDQAALLAEEAFAGFSQASGQAKGQLLRRIAEGIVERSEEIIDRANCETALPRPRLENEIGRTCNQLRFFAGIVEDGSWVDARIDTAQPDRTPLPKPDIRAMLRPIGPVAVFGASNFPLAFSVAGGDTASALAAGCPVIVKAHPAHPGTSELVGMAIQEAIRECGLPVGVFSLLFDDGYDVGVRLVSHPATCGVGFTGSHKGGMALMAAAAKRADPIPFYAEMGSLNPVFILKETLERNAESIATGLHGSVTLGVGQFCTKPGLVFLEDSIGAETFLSELGRVMSTALPGTMLTSGILDSFRTGIKRLSTTSDLKALGEVESQTGQDATGATPTAFVTDAETFLGNPGLATEVFGPCVLLVQCADRNQMLAAARSLSGQLTATVHGTDDEIEAARPLLAVLETKAGRLLLNGFPTGVEVCTSMVHGGPFPATSDGRSTSVGYAAIHRFARAVCYQGFSESLLPDELKAANPLRISRVINGSLEFPPD